MRARGLSALILLLLLCGEARAQTPSLVRDIHPGAGSHPELVPLFPTRAGDLVFFWGWSPAEGQEVWRSDGTAEGTFLLRDILPGPETSDSNGSDDNEMAAAGDLVFFVASDVEYGGELWRSDGTPAGTFQVSDIVPGPGGPDPIGLTSAGDLLFFRLQEDDGVHDLWRSDGTPEGTFGIDLGSEATSPGGLADFHGTLFFFAWDALGHVGLWKSDGTEAGTIEVTGGPEPWLGSRRDHRAGGPPVLLGPDCRRTRAVEERRHGGRHRAGEGLRAGRFRPRGAHRVGRPALLPAGRSRRRP